MNEFERNARATGYADAFSARENQRILFSVLTGERSAYDLGYQDGEAIRAARSGEIPLATSPRFGQGWSTHRTVPRLMLADDITSPGDWERSRLKDMEQRKLRENAYYFMQYLMATDALNFAVPSYVLEVLKDAERQAKVVTGIDLASRPDETAVRAFRKSPALGMGFYQYGGPVTGRMKSRQPLIRNLPRSEKPKWNACGQCEGTGTTQSASNLQDEECPVCDGSGLLP